MLMEIPQHKTGRESWLVGLSKSQHAEYSPYLQTTRQNSV